MLLAGQAKVGRASESSPDSLIPETTVGARRREANRGRKERWSQAIVFSGFAFVVSRALVVLLALVVPIQHAQTSVGWFKRLVSAADANWYLSIANGGYAHIPFDALHPVQENWAFFPLLPVSTRIIAHIVGLPTLTVGLVLVNASFLGFLIFLYYWVARDWDRQAARVAVGLAAFSPLSAYFIEFRPESIFLLLSAVCLERIVSRHLGHAVVVGALATLAEPNAVLLVLPFLIACVSLLWDPAHRRQGVIGVLLSPLFGLGGATMAWVSASASGSALAFDKVQAAWGREFRLPFTPFFTFLNHPSWTADWGWSSPPTALMASIVGLAAAWYMWRRHAPLELVIYVLAVVIGASSSTVLIGAPQFIAEAVPIYIAGGLAFKRVAAPILLLSLATLVTYSAYWLVGADWTMGMR